MQSLREKLFGKMKPLREKLASLAEKTDNFSPINLTVRGVMKAGEIADDALGLPGRIATGFNDAVPKGFSEQVGQATEAVTGNKTAGMVTGLAAGIASPGIGGSEIKAGKKVFDGFTDLTTKTLDKLVGRGKVSKQFISDLLNAPDVRQAEKDVMRAALDEADDVVDVASYADKVKTNLLPLNFADTSNMPSQGFLYETVTLPDNLRGPVAKYNERIYESPIAVGAGDVHFSRQGVPNYFAHTRIEDLPNYTGKAFGKDGLPNSLAEARGETGTTRRVIEIQSDLMQKGRLDAEVKNSQSFLDLSKERNGLRPDGTPISPEVIKKAEARIAENEKLAPYRNTWHERIIREEVKQAAVDGKTKLQFPVGKTAMQIEGLGSPSSFVDEAGKRIEIGDLTVGKKIQGTMVNGLEDDNDWIVTDVLGDGKFKAVPKKIYDEYNPETIADYKLLREEPVGMGDEQRKVFYTDGSGKTKDILLGYFADTEEFLKQQTKIARENVSRMHSISKETFDISGKVDESNPIYKFYEKDVAKFLQKNYGAKRITDPQGVEWWEMDVKPELKDKPVYAHGMSKVGTLGAVAGAGVAAVAGKAAYDNKERLAMVPDAVKEVYGYEGEEPAKEPERIQIATTTPEMKEPEKKGSFDREAFRQGIAHNESRGTADPYRAVGPTKDLGKYQASPDTLKAWSKAWLGKEYTPEEFLNDPDAQERFFEAYNDVAERLGLTHEQAAVAWHRGWGELGTGSKDTRDARFLKRLNEMMDDEISQAYLESFRNGVTPSSP